KRKKDFRQEISQIKLGGQYLEIAKRFAEQYPGDINHRNLTNTMLRLLQHAQEQGSDCASYTDADLLAVCRMNYGFACRMQTLIDWRERYWSYLTVRSCDRSDEFAFPTWHNAGEVAFFKRSVIGNGKSRTPSVVHLGEAAVRVQME